MRFVQKVFDPPSSAASGGWSRTGVNDGWRWRVTPPRGLKPEAEGVEQKRGDEEENLKEEVFRKREERRKQGLREKEERGKGTGKEAGQAQRGNFNNPLFQARAN